MKKHVVSHILSLLVLIGFGVLAVGSGDGSVSDSSRPPTTVQPPSEKAVAMANLSIKKLNWHKGGFDNVMMVDVTFQNSGEKDVKDVELTCEHYSNSGTRIDSNRKTVYEIVPANKTKRVREFNMGFIHSQAAQTDCKITNLVVQ